MQLVKHSQLCVISFAIRERDRVVPNLPQRVFRDADVGVCNSILPRVSHAQLAPEHALGGMVRQQTLQKIVPSLILFRSRVSREGAVNYEGAVEGDFLESNGFTRGC